MPTCSTAKLPSKYQTGGPGLFYKRYRRPQSCKYDTYRTRARRSVVDETLFGEPLNKQLLARSRSMETISCGEEARAPIKLQPSTIKSQQRPKTALATMHVHNRDPEFTSPEFTTPRRELPKISSSVVITSSEFMKIREAARAMTAEEKSLLATGIDPNRPPSAEKKASSPWAVRRNTALPERIESPAQEESSPRDGAFLERAQRLREENIEEVRKLNELILSAKCNAVLDSQVSEKEKRLAEMVESDRHLEEAMEEERKKADQMTTARDNHINKFYKEYRNQLQHQLDEVQAERLLQRERKEREAVLRKRDEDVAREEDRKTKEQKLKLKLELQEQLRTENEELKRRKKKEEEWHRANDQRIHELEEKRRQVEEEREQMEKDARRRREQEISKLTVAQEREVALELRREEVRLQRQKESKERDWRQRQIEKAKENQERQQQILDMRNQQVELKRRSQAEAAKDDRHFWEEQASAWKSAVEEQQKKEEERQLAKLQYQQNLQAQMEKNQAMMNKNKKEELLISKEQEMQRIQHQETVNRVKERKLQQLKTYNIPDKYVKQIERRCDAIQNAKFTQSYHGKK